MYTCTHKFIITWSVTTAHNTWICKWNLLSKRHRLKGMHRNHETDTTRVVSVIGSMRQTQLIGSMRQTQLCPICVPTMSNLRKMKWETWDLKTKWNPPKKNSGNSGHTPVARGGSGAKAPLAARPNHPNHRRNSLDHPPPQLCFPPKHASASQCLPSLLSLLLCTIKAETIFIARKEARRDTAAWETCVLHISCTFYMYIWNVPYICVWCNLRHVKLNTYREIQGHERDVHHVYEM